MDKKSIEMIDVLPWQPVHLAVDVIIWLMFLWREAIRKWSL